MTISVPKKNLVEKTATVSSVRSHLSDLLDLSDSDIASTVVTLKLKSFLLFTSKSRVVELCISPDPVLLRPLVPVQSSTPVLRPTSDPKRMLIVGGVHLPTPQHSLDLNNRKLAMSKRQSTWVL